MDHVTTDKLVSYILRGVLHPPVISWPVHLLLHILNNIVHTSHGNKPVLTLTLPGVATVLIANTKDCGTCQHHVC